MLSSSYSKTYNSVVKKTPLPWWEGLGEGEQKTMSFYKTWELFPVSGLLFIPS
jgi:hypothetical protein